MYLCIVNEIINIYKYTENMSAHFTTVFKKRAIKNVLAFHDFSMRQIKVISNSANYQNSVTLSMDIYCDNVDGYIFNNTTTNEQYALTAF